MFNFRPRERDLRGRFRTISGLASAAVLGLLIITLGAAWSWQLCCSGGKFGAIPPILGPLLAATAAALSLIYSLGRARDNSRDQYTLSLVSARFERADYLNHARIIHEWFDEGRLTPHTTLEQLGKLQRRGAFPDISSPRQPHQENDAPPLFSLAIMLNYWEHVCTAYVDGRINRRIFEDTVQDLIREIVAKNRCAIGGMRTPTVNPAADMADSGTNQAARREPTNMEHLCAVWFILASSDERQTAIPDLGPTPQRLARRHRKKWQATAERQRALAASPTILERVIKHIDELRKTITRRKE